MGITIAILATLFFITLGAHAQTTNIESFNPNVAIPDGNLAGITLSGAVSDISPGATIGGLTISLNISGGYDGGLYAYLMSPDGTTVTLLDEPGVTVGNSFGNEGSGMNVTLVDGGTPITASSDLSSGIYAGIGTLADFNGLSPDGTWQLFIANEMTSGSTGILNSWALQMTTSVVPEPTTTALGIFGMMCLIAALKRRQSVNK